MDLVFIWVLILASSFSLVVIRELRYLKQWVNCICWLLGRVKLVGSVPFAVRAFAYFKESGKNMASVLDFMSLFPSCICIPKCLKCWMRRSASSSSSSQLSVMKIRLPTKNTLLSSKVVPLDIVGY